MLFNSLNFLIFFPLVTLEYYLIPHKARYIWLLVASYYFYMCWNVKYALLLAFCTLTTYLSGLLIKRAMDVGKVGWAKVWLALSFTINIGILFFFKYFYFVIDNINLLLSATGLSLINPSFDVLLPVGISFYTFQALSYTVDVYRGDVAVEKNLLRYAAFVSFFPQLMSGPIGRSNHLLGQFYEKHTFNYERVKNGLLMMLWGYFQKLVVADRVAVLVNQVFDYYPYYTGFEILVGILFFTVQIYCDFAGYSSIAIGAAQVMGFDLMQNFKEPYLARSVGEFWRRWHISLSTWFRDYLYIPLGGNRKGTVRKYVNMMIIFLVSGLWHGARWTYVIWGGLNGLYQVVGGVTQPARRKALAALRVNTESWGYKGLQMLITFGLTNLAWVFFRASSLSGALGVLRQLFAAFNPWILFNQALYTLGLDRVEFMLALLFIAALLVVDLAHYRGVSLRGAVAAQPLVVRWAIYIAALYIVLIFGSYGPSFNAGQFIYSQF